MLDSPFSNLLHDSHLHHNSRMAANNTRYRRWYQISLRSLLVFTAFVAVGCCWLENKIGRKRREREAVEAILKLGGRVTYDYQTEKQAGPRGPGWLRGVIGENFFCEVDVVLLRANSKIGDGDLALVKEFPHLHSLSLRGTGVGDAGIVNLKSLSELQFLALGETNVTDAGLEAVACLRQLQSLSLSLTNVSDA